MCLGFAVDLVMVFSMALDNWVNPCITKLINSDPNGNGLGNEMCSEDQGLLIHLVKLKKPPVFKTDCGMQVMPAFMRSRNGQ